MMAVFEINRNENAVAVKAEFQNSFYYVGKFQNPFYYASKLKKKNLLWG
jgi:hypothetical protein